jgi:hypothetical protein
MRVLIAAVSVCIATTAWADLCTGKRAGTFLFFDQEISRDKPLPKPVDKLELGKPAFALACLTDKAGPQAQGGTKFRVVLYVKAIDLPEGKYSSWAAGKQAGLVRPQLSQARKEIILELNEDFGEALKGVLDPGKYEFRLQAATEKPTGKLDITVDLKNEVAYVQELRKAGYLADGKVTVTHP